jgi:hypothetical protein
LGFVLASLKKVWENWLAREEFREQHLFPLWELSLLLHPWREHWWLIALVVKLHMTKALVNILFA